jgi:CubicO group peptidase (beta-lactamase class C family)
MRYILLFLTSMTLLGSFACNDSTGDDSYFADGGPDGDADTDTDTDTDTEIPNRYAKVVSMFEDEMSFVGAPGAALAIVEGGQVKYAGGFGTKHPDGGSLVEATTLFHIGSVNKVLTAVGLLQQVEKDNVDLESPITKYLPDFRFFRGDEWAPSIKVRHLLTHSTGILDYLEINAEPDMQDDAALEEYMVDTFTAFAYLMAPSGRMYNYSNPNFMLAGLITEKTSGSYYREYMREQVFLPLGMERTMFTPEEVIADGDYAYGLNNVMEWGPELPAIMAPDTYDNPWARPAGYAWSSVLDMAEFIKFLRDGNEAVLGHELWREMQSPQVGTKEFYDFVHYGYGLTINKPAFFPTDESGEQSLELEIISHGGAISGYSAFIAYFPELDVGLVTLANSDGAYFNETLSELVRTLGTDLEAKESPDITVDPGVFDSYIGEYYDQWNVGTMIVTVEGDNLLIEMPLLEQVDPPVPYETLLTPYAGDSFILGIQGTELLVTFILSDNGEVEYLRTRSFVGEKVITKKQQKAALFPPVIGPEKMRIPFHLVY